MQPVKIAQIFATVCWATVGAQIGLLTAAVISAFGCLLAGFVFLLLGPIGLGVGAIFGIRLTLPIINKMTSPLLVPVALLVGIVTGSLYGIVAMPTDDAVKRLWLVGLPTILSGSWAGAIASLIDVGHGNQRRIISNDEDLDDVEVFS